MALPYTMNSRFPVQCYTDHSPLTWIKHTSGKGPVSQFLIDNLSMIDFEMHYIKGPDNILADALSRFPMLGPRRLKQKGRKQALNILLAGLTDFDVNTDRIWFNAQKDTTYLLNDLYEWRNAITSNTDTESERTRKLVILILSLHIK